MADTWDRTFFDIQDEQQDTPSYTTVIEADASGVRDVGQTAESPQTVGEYTASLPVVQPEVQQVPGPEVAEQDQAEPVDVFAMQAEPPDFTSSTDVDMTGYEWPETATPVSGDTMSPPVAGVELPRRFQLRQEQQRRQEARANIRQLSKTDPRAATEAANAERLERHRRQDWEDTFPEFEPQQEAEQPVDQPEPTQPDPDKQRKLQAIAQSARVAHNLQDYDPANVQMPFWEGSGQSEKLLRAILEAINKLPEKMNLDARWGM